MKAPTQCILWKHPEVVKEPRSDRFECLETYEDDSHWSRCLLKCRECGQRYFYEFYEQIDWVDGDDPQYVTYIPVESAEDIEALKQTSELGLLRFGPRLQKDWPKGATEAKIHWVE
jgi:hypothetical protein